MATVELADPAANAQRWQGMTYGTGPYDPMFTFTIKPDGVWTDLTFGEAKAVDGKYTYDSGNKALTLIIQAGTPCTPSSWSR